MKIVFVSNFLNHHQEPFSNEIIKLLGKDNYRFIATEAQAWEQHNLGYVDRNGVDYCIRYYESAESQLSAEKWIREADAVIIGGVSYRYTLKRWLRGKTVIKYGERIMKKGTEGRSLKECISMFLFHTCSIRRTDYFLAASAYASGDYWKHFAYGNRMLKWGYFPECQNYDIDNLIKKKNVQEIIWCGRLIDWKHPECIVEVARKLKREQIPYTFTVVGTGVFRDKLMEIVSSEDLNVHFAGAVSSNQVRTYMERAGVMMTSSDYNEGWGVVVNEGMNSGCAMVASIAMGAVPYLISDGINGRIFDFHNTDECYGIIKELLTDPEQQRRLGREAYLTISQIWNASEAAKRLVAFLEALNRNELVIPESGPCSRAELRYNTLER